jgi:putative mRNA 3-end processing factor
MTLRHCSQSHGVDIMGENISITADNGITVHLNDVSISLDPSRTSNTDYTFISHAHIDHLNGSQNIRNILASRATKILADKRGYRLNIIDKSPDNFRMYEAGHILGSRGILIGDEVYYTGDFSIRQRAFIKGCIPVKSRILIMESTFGKKNFLFPPIAETLKEVNELISGLFSKGIPVILLGYSLGKAQILSYMFSSWEPIYLEDSILEMNQAHIDLGINLRRDMIPFSKAETDGLLQKKPWILIAPLRSGRSKFLNNLKKNYGAVTIGFSGWSVDPRYKYRMNLDYAYPFSDHCDFEDLVDMAKRCNPEKIYVVHGFAREFGIHLRSLGFDATELKNGQPLISDYLA